jgi:hypothetical protein
MNSTLLSSCFLLLLTLLSASRAQRPSTLRLRKRRHHLIPPGKLPFRLQWGYLVIVEGSIGDLHGLNFLVDTGASPSIVDQKIARSLGLAGQPARVTLSGTSVPTQLVVLPSLLVGRFAPKPSLL